MNYNRVTYLFNSFSIFGRFIILAMHVLMITQGFGQDTHFWTQQFGSRSALLGGAVVGGVRDNSAAYYNPGALAQVDSLTLSVSATAYQLDKLDIHDGAGTDLDLNSNQTQIIPLMISGLYRFKNAPRHTLGYSVLGKQQTGIKFSARKDGFMNIIQDSNSPGDEEFIGQYNLKSGLNEQYFGLTYAFRATKHFSVGLTNYIAYRTQYLEETYVARAIPDLDEDYYYYITPLNATNILYSAEFSNLRALWKIGFDFDFGKLKLGATITTPSIDFGGKASVNADQSATSLNWNGAEWTDYVDFDTMDYSEFVVGSDDFSYFELYSFTANDRQENLNTYYKSPLSIALGSQYQFGKTTICASAEWFNSVPLYYQVIPKDNQFIRPVSIDYDVSSSDILAFRESSKSITNYAVAIDQEITPKLHILAGARTNYSSFEDNNYMEGDQLSFSTWDLYHISFGATIKREKSDLSVGVNYAFGSDPQFSQPVNFTNANEMNFMLGESTPVNAQFSSIGLIIGYTYYLK